LAEALAASDLVSAIKTAGGTVVEMTVGEAVTGSDGVSIVANFKMSIAETASAVDSFDVGAIAYALSISESLTITDIFGFTGDAGIITATIAITQILGASINDNPLISGDINDKPIIDGDINDIPVITGTITVS